MGARVGGWVHGRVEVDERIDGKIGACRIEGWVGGWAGGYWSSSPLEGTMCDTRLLSLSHKQSVA